MTRRIVISTERSEWRNLYEILDGNGFRDFGDAGFEGLLGGGEGDAEGAVGLVDLALGALADRGHDAVHTDFRGLFHKPFEAVVVLGGAAGDGEPVGMAAPAGEGLEHLGLGPLGVVVDQSAAEHRPEPVDHVNLVAGAVPQHAAAVAGLVGVQPAEAAVGLICVEQFHYIRMISTSPSMPTLMIWEALPVESVSMEGGTTKSTASLIS